MRNRAALLMALLMLSLQSCTAVRDTTPCNSTRYIELAEQTTLTADEQKLFDSLDVQCKEYSERQKLDPANDEYEGAGWLGAGVVAAGLLLIAYLSGLFG